MPMARPGTYTQLGCRWLTIGLIRNTVADDSLLMGLTHNSDADGPLKDLNTTRMLMAHHGTYAQLGCQWLTMGTYTHRNMPVALSGLTHTRAQLALHGTYTQLGCRWLTTGLTHNTDANGSPRDLHTTRMPMAHRRTYT